MASYAYTAINARGLEVDGVIAANDLGSAREQLQRRGLLADKISEVDTSERARREADHVRPAP